MMGLSLSEARAGLRRLAWRWNAMLLACCLLEAGAAGAVFGKVWVGCLAFVALLAWRRRRFGGSALLARHLDRWFPQLEESCGLLLEPDPSSLRLLQRERVLAALARLGSERRLPRGPLLRSAVALSLGLLLAWALRLGAGEVPTPPAAPPLAALSKPSPIPRPAAPELASVEVKVEPPAYTKLPSRVFRQLDVQAPEGSRVSWRLETTRPLERLTLAFEGGASLELPAELEAKGSGLYSVEGFEGGRVALRSALARLDVQPDAPPQVRILEPASDLELAEPRPVPLLVRASDDYAIAGLELVSTLTSGQGEAVQFREQRQPLPLDAAGEARFVFDLAALGMKPGDELYFSVEAWDNREPQANRTRGRTYFLRLKAPDSERRASLEGLEINPLPESFRSERQIILDTERLLAEQSGIPKSEFDRRSQDIGWDQRLLRMRYGVLLGEETESGEEGGEDLMHVHEHDSAEISTFFTNEVRTTLKAALASMWKAEGFLRVGDPASALPHEYAALRHLKSVQEAERVYVQRVGFEPPPLKPEEKRLTGELAEVRSQALETRREPVPESIAGADSALRCIERARAGSADYAELEAIRPALARRALEGSAAAASALESLRQLRAGSACATCLDSVEAGLWSLLPEPRAAPRRRP